MIASNQIFLLRNIGLTASSKIYGQEKIWNTCNIWKDFAHNAIHILISNQQKFTEMSSSLPKRKDHLRINYWNVYLQMRRTSFVFRILAFSSPVFVQAQENIEPNLLLSKKHEKMKTQWYRISCNRLHNSIWRAFIRIFYDMRLTDFLSFSLQTRN